MVAAAVKLAPLCPKEPEAGAVIEADDGTLTWFPARPLDPV